MNKLNIFFTISMLLVLLTGCAGTLTGSGSLAPAGIPNANNVGQPYGQPPYAAYGYQGGQVASPIWGFPAGNFNPHFGSRPPCTNQGDFDDICAQTALMQSSPQGPVVALPIQGGSNASNPPVQSSGQAQVGTQDLGTRVQALEQEVGAQGAALEGVIRRTRR